MPLFGDWTEPSGFVAEPPRQPTAAMTLPPGSSDVPPGSSTTTSVTMFAKTQRSTRLDLPAHGPVGRFTFAYETPASAERNRPAPVAAYTTLEFVGSTARL